MAGRSASRSAEPRPVTSTDPMTMAATKNNTSRSCGPSTSSPPASFSEECLSLFGRLHSFEARFMDFGFEQRHLVMAAS